jgi:hypothetical protein
MSQSKYVIDIMVRFHMTKLQAIATTPFLSRVKLEDGVIHLWLIVPSIVS